MFRRRALPAALGAAALLALAVFAACNGGGGGDQAQIEKLARDTVAALEDLDGKKMAGLMSKECDVDEAEMEAAFALIRVFAGEDDLEIDLDDIEITNLTDTSADVRLVGTIKIMGEEQPLDEEGSSTRAVKEDGKWRWSDCEDFNVEG
ncbi:MAG TPA: hypothetical protein VIO14_04675 [Dehalococcoidia bacterium]